MIFLKVTKNIGGKIIRVNPNYIVEIEEAQVDEDPEAKPAADKKEKQKKAVTIIRRAKGKDLFVTETPDEIEKQILTIREIKIVL